ncbi:hypothetical protein A3I48_00765 [Candidatus Daviesbacteria bacterium RIFCSPLOWO2_02_FULL_36_7]|uniref:Antitoxin n=1 Tax=Candidatus Daviesbacteria bacterium RIFCSPLOWO2_02_FULL_36_7 TaxID=1797792 RepID=A0A1F5MHW9_9BACT|nr:MAG: hypothetical protein A3I48_00765 [Candidatus Daviesbacteria bacterium RIFCSPLOWO2_02_FULL_36_7]
MQTLTLGNILQNKFIGTDYLRKSLSEILDKLPEEKKLVITQNGQPKGVLIDINSYLEYEELLEQIADSDPKLIKRINAALADVKKNGGIPAEEVFKQLGI